MPGDALATADAAIASAAPLRRPRTRILWILAVVLGFQMVAMVVVAVALSHHRSAPPLAGTGLRPAFTLRDSRGATVTASTLTGRFALVYFGYTYCPDICPTELGFEEKVLKALGPDAQRITPVFISVDPERDTPRLLGEYVALFDPRMVAWTGTQAQLHEAITGFGGMFDRQGSAAGQQGYLINHTSSIYLLGPSGEVLLLCDSHDNVDVTAASVRAWLDQ